MAMLLTDRMYSVKAIETSVSLAELDLSLISLADLSRFALYLTTSSSCATWPSPSKPTMYSLPTWFDVLHCFTIPLRHCDVLLFEPTQEVSHCIFHSAL